MSEPEAEPLTDSDGSELFDDLEFCHGYITAREATIDALLSQLREQREQWSDAELIAEVQRRGLVVD